MAIGNGELMHFDTYTWARQKDKKTKKNKKRGVSIERSEAGTKKVLTAYHYLIKIQ